MSSNLTEEEFTKHVGSDFHSAAGEKKVCFKLTEVTRYRPQEHEQGGMERFSAFFAGPPDLLLPQRTYSMRHEQMGEFDIFLTPLSRDQKGVYYEAVFNYYRQSGE